MDLKIIYDVVCELCEIDIAKNTRKQEYVYARAVYFHVARMVTIRSFKDIGALVHKDHSTVSHVLKSVIPMLERYEPMYVSLMDKTAVKSAEKIANFRDRSEAERALLDKTLISANGILKKKIWALQEEVEMLYELVKDKEIQEYVMRVPPEKKNLFKVRLDIMTKTMART